MIQAPLLKYPKKSHRKAVRLPSDSVELAEFFGIMMGDGGINNTWQANVTLNTDADSQYIQYVGSLMKKMFDVSPAIRERRTSRATVVSLASTTIVDFLVSRGLPRGNKLLHGLRVPQWILTQKTYKMACVRGLVDTDGCLVLHTHKVAGNTYKNLYLSFSSASSELLVDVAQILIELGFAPNIAGNKREVYLYRIEDVKGYLKIVGTSNERIRRVHQKWRDG